MHEYEAGIIRTEFRCEKTCIIDLACKAIASEVVPGQFVQVRVCSGTDPFLRRTFSVCNVDSERGEIKLLVDIVGKGTELLCSMKRGMNVNIIGSLGAGFDLRLGGTGTCVLIAGGSGAAPLIFLANRLNSSVKRPIVFMMGARSSMYLRVIEGLTDDGVIVKTATDDGSAGFHGPVSELLDKQIESIRPGALYTCGPNTMMKAVSNLAEKYSIPCQISLEERMACGIGACLGCATPLRNGRMVRSCVDGPVFHASEVAW